MRGPIGSLRGSAAKLVVMALVVVLVLGQAPAQLWAEGVEGLARVSIELTGAEDDADGTDDAVHGESAEKLSEREPDGAADDASRGGVDTGADSSGEQQNANAAKDVSSAQGTGRDAAVQPSATTAAQPTATHDVDHTGEQTLTAIVDQLEADDWRLEPTYGVDTNANDLLLAQLAEMGVEDVEVRVSSVEIKVPNDDAELGISCADDGTNGDITYFYMDLDAVGFAGFVTYRQITPTFTLSRGDEHVEFTPARSTQMPWDKARVDALASEDVADTGDDEAPAAMASVAIVGTDAFGEDQVWAARADCILEQGATAADLIEQTLADAGLAHEATGVGGASYYLSTITAPDGRVLGWDEATGKYWQLFVNGAASAVGAGEVVLESGDEVALYYSAWGASPDDIGKAKITVSAQVIGPDAGGADTSWAPLTELSLPQGSTAADLTERACALAGLEADTGTGSYGWYLNSITSPFTGEVLGTTKTADGGWRYWQLFVNGAPSELGAGSVVLNPGDQVVWYYSEWGASLPENEVAVDPGAWDDRPNDWAAAWHGFAPGVVEGVASPTEGGELAWSVNVESSVGSASAVYQSDPVIVNGRVYVAVGDTLKVYRAQDGRSIGSAKLATAIDSASRMVYADGLIVVPLHGGRLQALTADTLRTVSLSPAVASGQQALSSITVSGGYAYVGTTTAGGDAGVLYCVNLRTGALRWSVADDAGAGYYWTGGVLAGGYYAAIDGAGTVTVRDVATGSAVSTLALGEDVRAQLVADPDDASTLYTVTRDGVLHRIALGEDGSLAETGSVAFATSSTSTPVIAGGYAYVGGGTAAFTGVLAVINLSHMQVVHAITTYADGISLPGAVQSTPAVTVQDGATYVYFTCNAAQGSAYLYCVGDAEAKLLYQPEAGKTGWCLSSIAVGSDGALYYLNDSGHLFRIDAGPALEVTGPGEGTQAGGSSDGDDNASAAPLQQLVSKVVTTIRLRGTSGAEQDEGSSASLLEGYTSADVVRSLLVATPREGGDASQGDAASTTMPIWPFAGMALGALALIAAVASGRGDKERR